MYRKVLIALACAVISAPAFAQSSLPQCPDGLRYHQQPCSYLQWNLSPASPPPDLTPHRPPNWDSMSSQRYGYDRSNPQAPPSTLDNLGKRLGDSGPTWSNGPAWKGKY